ncbi:MAG: hypothetical protein JNK26_00945 [Candidatus Doudnabacteria bacterium]|nr:hypothetical protein [Candidatus Doudnabacteria bacterium]
MSSAQKLVNRSLLLLAFAAILLVVLVNSGREVMTTPNSRVSAETISTTTQPAVQEWQELILVGMGWSADVTRMRTLLNEYAVENDLAFVFSDALGDEDLKAKYGIENFPSLIIRSSDDSLFKIDGVTLEEIQLMVSK